MAVPNSNTVPALDQEGRSRDRKNATALRPQAQTQTIGRPRGILKPYHTAGEFRHAQIAPPVQLQDVVQHFWIVEWNVRSGARALGETLPHPNVHIVFDRHEARVAGIQSGRFTRSLEGRGAVFGIKFKAGAFRPFLKRSVSTLRNRSVPLESVYGDTARALPSQVLARADDQYKIETVSRFLIEHLPPEDCNAQRAACIVREIESNRDILSVEHLLERTKMNKRSLQRLFCEYVGVGPKWVINRYRLHEALERLSFGAPADWTGLAHELGYFDQSHFIRDFKSIVGRSPADYARNCPAPDRQEQER
jgi:AraC-like DNA-binding protein